MSDLEREALFTDPFHAEDSSQTGSTPVLTALGPDLRSHPSIALCDSVPILQGENKGH